MYSEAGSCNVVKVNLVLAVLAQASLILAVLAQAGLIPAGLAKADFELASCLPILSAGLCQNMCL